MMITLVGDVLFTCWDLCRGGSVIPTTGSWNNFSLVLDAWHNVLFADAWSLVSGAPTQRKLINTWCLLFFCCDFGTQALYAALRGIDTNVYGNAACGTDLCKGRAWHSLVAINAKQVAVTSLRWVVDGNLDVAAVIAIVKRLKQSLSLLPLVGGTVLAASRHCANLPSWLLAISLAVCVFDSKIGCDSYVTAM